MTNEEMLKKLVKLARKRDSNLFGGWQHFEVVVGGVGFYDADYVNFVAAHSLGRGELLSVEEILFSHDFAKAIFSEDPICPNCGDFECDCNLMPIRACEYFLQQMVLEPEEDRIKYAYENRKK